MQADKKAREP
jgi:hypothetical protein